MQNDSTSNPDFDSIYSPETQSLVEATGLNIKLSDLSEISALMDETAGQANLAMDSFGPVTQELAAAAKKDEKQYVEKSRGKFGEALVTDANERRRYDPYNYPYQERITKEKEAAFAKSVNENDPRVWHLANDKSVWRTSSKLGLAEELKSLFSKEELYWVLELSNHLRSPDHRIGFAQMMKELYQALDKTNFKTLCEKLLNEGKKDEVEANMKLRLLYALKEELGQNFKLAEMILKEPLDKTDTWVLYGKDFFKSDELAYQAFLKTMKALTFDYSHHHGHLGEKAELLLYWIPVCGSSVEKLEALKKLLPKLSYLSNGNSHLSEETPPQELATDPNAFEKLKIVLDLEPTKTMKDSPLDQIHLLQSLKERSLHECEALEAWVKTNGVKEDKLLGVSFYQLLRLILTQKAVLTHEALQAWTEEFKKITNLLKEELQGLNDYDRETLVMNILYASFHVQEVDVKRVMEGFRELKRKNNQEATKGNVGEIAEWMKIQKLWNLSPEEFEEVKEACKKIAPEKLNKAIFSVDYLRELYEKDHHNMILCIEVLAKHRSVTIEKAVHLNRFRTFYEKDIAKMDETFTILDEVRGEDPGAILETLSKIRVLYGEDPVKLSEVLDTLNSFVDEEYDVESLKEKLSVTVGLKEMYGNDLIKLNEFAQVLNSVENWDFQLSNSIIRLKETYAGKISTMKKIIVMLLEYRKSNPQASLDEFTGKLCQFEGMIREDAGKIKLLQLYMEQTPILEQKTVNKFVAIHEAEGEEAAKNYLEKLKAKAKGLISSGIPEEQRAMEEYKFLVQYVYPKGNYSDHEKNLACGDHLEHIEAYQFDRKGYPIVLSGLQGYGLKNGEKENPGLLDAYSERLQKMRAFVSSRGPDNKLLQEAFDKKIAGIFEGKAEASFKEIKDLSTKEKLFCLIVSEAIRKAKELGVGGARTLRTDETKVFEPDEEILDLVVEYKYAYHEDLEAYVQRSADDAKQYGDKISQNFVLWSELSVIYGENMKHVMKNEIMEKINSEPHFRTIVDSYVKTICELTSDDDVLTKARERIKSTLENAHIPAEKRAEVIWKQVWTLFSSNLKFASPEQGKLFEARMREVISPFLAGTSPENLDELLPKLLSLRNERRFDIGAKVEDLLSRDIGFVFKELAKYEELAEVEAKETSMNGPKNKLVEKSAKKRNIRGHITKTQESANARMGAYLCIAGDTSMWQNPNYFELVLEDEETNRCMGVAMMLKIDSEDGKKYLWFGPNPFESFLTQVSAKKTYDYMYKTVCNFASENGFDGVVVPAQENKILGACTNRGGEFPGFIKASRLKDEKGNIKVVQFGKNHTLGGSYGYTDGALVWESTATHST